MIVTPTISVSGSHNKSTLLIAFRADIATLSQNSPLRFICSYSHLSARLNHFHEVCWTINSSLSFLEAWGKLQRGNKESHWQAHLHFIRFLPLFRADSQPGRKTASNHFFPSIFFLLWNNYVISANITRHRCQGNVICWNYIFLCPSDVIEPPI